MKTVAPYGAWKSPIQAAQIAQAALRLGDVTCVGDAVYWNELRPAEEGRGVVVRQRPGGPPEDLVPPPFNARTRVHEYGGGAYLVHGDTLFFTNFADQRLYRVEHNQPPVPITPAADARFADGVMDPLRPRILCVREDHAGPHPQPVNAIVAIDPAANNTGDALVSGNDFYASPRFSPDGRRLAWLTWNHPHMPWDAAELWVAPVNDDGALGPASHVAGGPTESICQPEWSPDGVLHFASDRTGWWNLYAAGNGHVRPIAEMEAEFGRPQWVFRMSTYDFLDQHTIICTYTRDGLWQLAKISRQTSEFVPLDSPFNAIADLRACNGSAIFVGGAPTESAALVRMDTHTGAAQVLRRSNPVVPNPAMISRPQAVEFPAGNGLTAHGLFYPPQNPDYQGPPEEKPPLIVMIHGGPTSATTASLRLGIQYYTTRGLAVLDVNYGGSTGYGRPYRERLYGQWGVVDVDDCVNGARDLARRGLADGKRLAITGGSAGGYTTLAALAFRNVFAAGASHFGVSDCEALARETHKFESHYLEKLIGPYPARRDLYRQRSPLHHADRIAAPVAFFQGLEDRIVPPNQAEKMVAALRAKGIPVAYLPFAGEQHGFRQAGNIRRALEAELYFFSRIFGFDLADDVEPLAIDNLPSPPG